MLKTYYTEINPTEEQKTQIKKTIGVCRFVYNFYLARNSECYEKGEGFVTAKTFMKWLNNEYLKENPDFNWIKDVSSKAILKSVSNAEYAFKSFFKKKSRYPKFKKKNKSNVKMYFVRADANRIIPCERHRIKIPTLGWVRLKEKGYIPTDYTVHIIKSGSISINAGRYFISILVEEPDIVNTQTYSEGIGIDVGINHLAVISNGVTFENINKTNKMKKLQVKLNREQRRLSKKYKKSIIRRNNGDESTKNLEKQKVKVQKVYKRISNIKDDYINKCVNKVVKTKPQFITLEDLHVSGLLKNRHLSKAIGEQKLYSFRRKLTQNAKRNGIEVRIANRFYPSSKICNKCGAIKTDQKLSDRMYVCSCGYSNDRDLNASFNLRDLTVYTTA